MVENSSHQLRLPSWYGEQRATIPTDMGERSAIAASLHREVRDLLTSAGIVVLASSYRAKTDESIQTKQWRRLAYRRSWPIVDVYGTRFILGDENINRAADLIVTHYSPYGQLISGTEGILPMPYTVDYRNPENHSYQTSPSYKAVHVYFPFDGEEYYHIGEAQLLTPEWQKTANRTRRHFERKQFRNK